ncbi:MAG: energy transducer TonB [Ignavibacteria bacterium]|nr:energy transducer TonB [Ignavibacteria bacterium]
MNRYNDSPTFQLRLQWSPNTFKGFGFALGILILFIIISMFTKIQPPEAFILPGETTVLLSFGVGDGSGGSKGNLTAEGKASRGVESTNPLQDAQRAMASKSNVDLSDPSQSANLVPVKDAGRNKSDVSGTDAVDKSIGMKDGSADETGTGWVGLGKGRGLGYGVDWGGGGNRVVLNKPLPAFPPGTLNTEVKLRFRVRPDGSVSWVAPTRKGGNPAVDQAAIRAMYQWRFNPLNDEIDMEGTITFVFRNS